jgi:signal transduction histidine kinase
MIAATKSSTCSKADEKHLTPVLTDMGNPDNATALFADLRRLAAESPRDARARFVQLFESDSEPLQEVLSLAGRPGEGRLRQLIANSVKNRADKARIVPHLARWRELETDEFAKAAINAALVGVGSEMLQPPRPADLPQIVDTYRYVADRLCHRVRNSLTGPAQHLRKLDLLLNGAADQKTADVRDTVGRLRDSLRELSRIVEFNIEDEYFQWTSIDLPIWLKKMTDQYVAKNSPLTLRIVGVGENESLRIRANQLLLEILFWNLWKNAQQAAGAACEIVVNFSAAGSETQLLITDNGPGFTAQEAELAFVDQFSRRGSNHGRGLLEVHDAVRRLSGSVKLAPLPGGDYRIRLVFPLVTA